MKNIIKFSYNWNNKLSGQAFTTIRLKDDSRFIPGQTYEIFLKHGKEERFFCYAMIEAIKNLRLSEITTFMARLDTGYSREECIRIIQTMYKNVVKDWNTQQLMFILLVKEKTQKEKFVENTAITAATI